MSYLHVQENMPHHYLIVVVVGTLNSSYPNWMRLKYLPIYIHHDELINIENASNLSKDRMYKTGRQDAIRMFNCQQLLSTISTLRMSAMANHGTIHHFYCEEKLSDPEKFFESLVERANKSEHERKKLMDAMVRF